MGPNKLKRLSLEQRKVFCRAEKGEQVARGQKDADHHEGFWQSIFKGKVGEGYPRVSDQLVHNSLIC